MARVWRRQATPARGSPRREEVTFADVVERRDNNTTEDAIVPPQQVEEEAAVGKLEKVQSKRSKKRCRAEQLRRTQYGPEPLRRSPPTIQTADGPVHVCGQCLKPGHRADGCRRAIVCRRCAGTGHRAHQCKNPRATERQLLAGGPTRRHDGAEQVVQEKTTHERSHEALQKKMKNIVENPKNPKKRSREIEEEDYNQLEKREVQYNIHHLSVPLTSAMVRGKEALKHCTVATVTEVKEGMVSAKTVTGALSAALKGYTNKEQWSWPVKPFLDGRYMITCPTTVLARELERGGVLHLPKFSLSF
ncbi:hypothetical protein J5N97_020016 [Dioscorea zingiberensis]|uniref:CCHC-type domain-containing protein n=1 Tax=Dioscorea zingiberensis TaxID=325984 RepID=A0A9D5CG54_9LILI|nr:hypothetical protein J5N97_020016 [Dioscorea zingiberensis]